MEETKKYERQVAIKTTVQQLLSGKYMQENEQTPNYLLTESNEKIYRLNVMGIILGKEKQGAITNLLFDDGTGKITLRVFEENHIINSLNVGDVILSMYLILNLFLFILFISSRKVFPFRRRYFDLL